MIDLASWPYEQPPEEREMLARALDRCQSARQADQVLGAFLLLDLLADICLAPPRRRQVWRSRKPS